VHHPSGKHQPIEEVKSASINKMAQSFSTFITPAVFSSIQERPIFHQAKGLAPVTANSVMSAWISLNVLSVSAAF
jgi:hypothetical protein